MIKAHLSSQGKKMIKGDELEAGIELVYNKKKVQVDKEVERRAKARASLATMPAEDDLLG